MPAAIAGDRSGPVRIGTPGEPSPTRAFHWLVQPTDRESVLEPPPQFLSARAYCLVALRQVYVAPQLRAIATEAFEDFLSTPMNWRRAPPFGSLASPSAPRRE